jgi:hypothetical protein
MGSNRTTRLAVFLAVLFLGGSAAQSAVVLSEGFNDFSVLPLSGWGVSSNSAPPGTTSWFQGNPGVFPSQAGAPDAYAAANFESAAYGGNISTWLFTPVLTLLNGDVISFYTRTVDAPFFPDRLEVRYSTAGASVNVGVSDASVGDFTNLLLTINPALDPAGYPSAWTQYSGTVTGLGAPATGRYAFRYFVPDTSVNAEYIGLDTVVVDSSIPEPSTFLSLGAGLAALALGRARPRSR